MSILILTSYHLYWEGLFYRSTINYNNCFEISPFITREPSSDHLIVSMSVWICESFVWIKIWTKDHNKGGIIYIKGKIDWIKVYCIVFIVCWWNRKSFNYQQIEYYFQKVYVKRQVRRKLGTLKESFIMIFLFCEKRHIYDRHK